MVAGRVQALGLVSGGLDSLLALRVVAERGLVARGLCLSTGFGRPAYEARAARTDGVELHDVSERYLREVVVGAKHGYGSGMNPCIDCRAFMLREADRVARERGIDLLFSGEVVGQRAFDQSRAALERTARLAAVQDRLLRPLCAGLMPETEAERRGILDRRGALRLHGSSRRQQLALARRLGLEDAPTPSGGCCRLADRRFARRLRDLLAHRGLESVGGVEIEMLARGRHFRLDWRLKVVLGRDRAECCWLDRSAGERPTLQVASGRGCLALVDGPLDDEARLREAASLAARYSAERQRPAVEVRLSRRGAAARLITVPPAPAARLAGWRI